MSDLIETLTNRISQLQDIIINLQEKHYEDMKDFAHQHAKMAADVINLQLGGEQLPMEAAQLQLPEEDSAMAGGEIS